MIIYVQWPCQVPKLEVPTLCIFGLFFRQGNKNPHNSYGQKYGTNIALPSSHGMFPPASWLVNWLVYGSWIMVNDHEWLVNWLMVHG